MKAIARAGGIDRHYRMRRNVPQGRIGPLPKPGTLRAIRQHDRSPGFRPERRQDLVWLHPACRAFPEGQRQYQMVRRCQQSLGFFPYGPLDIGHDRHAQLACPQHDPH